MMYDLLGASAAAWRRSDEGASGTLRNRLGHAAWRPFSGLGGDRLYLRLRRRRRAQYDRPGQGERQLRADGYAECLRPSFRFRPERPLEAPSRPRDGMDAGRQDMDLQAAGRGQVSRRVDL